MTRETAPLVVAVSGASGFVGRALVGMLAADARFACRACYRQFPAEPPANVAVHLTGDLDNTAGWQPALDGAQAVVHVAARAHVLRDEEADPAAAYRRTNVEGSLALARSAIAAGVRRFVFISSIKVNGEATPADRPFTPEDPPAPEDDYGRSKLETERALAALAAETGLELVVLRPPLVLGPGARGNLERLSRWIGRGIPLPFGALRNRRSLIHVESLGRAIMAALVVPQAAGRTYLVADRDWSTPDLVRSLAQEAGRDARLLPVPASLLRVAGRLSGRQAEVERLVGSLLVDPTASFADLGDYGSKKPASSSLR